MIINVTIADKKAKALPHKPLVCGNSGYSIEFAFDAEWAEYRTKTARFIFDDKTYTDVIFEGTTCPVPILKNTLEVIVGVYAGNLRTTTPAYLSARRSILCGCGKPADPDPDVYAQIMDRLNKINDDIGGAVKDYLEENPIEGTTFEPDENNLTLIDGVLSVNTTDEVTESDPRPITAQGVYGEFAVINALLKTI